MDIENKNKENEMRSENDMPELKDRRIGEDPSEDIMDKLRNFLDLSFETIRVVIVSLIIIFIVRSFVIQPFFVKGASMEPNFEDGNYLIVNEIGYRLESPNRGDVIVFKYPNDPSEYFIKRVIGLPGESIEIKNNKITIYNAEHLDGFVLDESAYLPSTTVTSGTIFETLGDTEYYVLGDNRIASSDSRRWGKLDNRFIIGKAWVRAWPFDDFRVFGMENYSG
ncbi:MAG: signal peptidase I [Candidatus Paceibacterota bacterium]